MHRPKPSRPRGAPSPFGVLAVTAALLLAPSPASPSGDAGNATANGGGAEAIAIGPGESVEDLQSGAFDYFANSWTVVGLPDLPDGTRISPRFELLLSGGVSVAPLIGKDLRPLPPRLRKTLEDDHLPAVLQRFVLREGAATGGLEHRITAFATPLPEGIPEAGPKADDYLTLLVISVASRGEEPAQARLALEWRPAQPLELRSPAGDVPALVLSGGKLAAVLRAPGARASVDGSRLVLDLALAGKAAAEVVLALPFRPLTATTPDWAARAVDAGRLKEQALAGWRALLARGARLSVPEGKVLATYRASLVYQFIGLDRGELHAGEGFYDELYLRDGAYQAISLAHAGYLDEARHALEFFFRHQKPDGQFVTQEGQLDANGYALWALVEYGLIAGDEAWLERIYPALRRSVEWIGRTRGGPAAAVPGVLPPAPADGEFLWEGKNRIVGYDLWNLRGLRSTAVAARRLGKTAEADGMEREAEGYLRAILAAASRAGVPYLPPSYEGAGTPWGNLEAAFPTPLLDPHDALVTATLDHVTRDLGAPGGPEGFVEGVIQWRPGTGAIHPYLSQFVTNSRIVRGEREEAVEGLYSFLLHTTSTHGFPEGVYYQRREGWGSTIPHLWAAALWVTTLRNALLREEGEDIHLLSAVPAGWLAPGKRLALEGAPTRLGPAGFRAEGAEGTIRIAIKPSSRTPPARVVIHAPAGLRITGAERSASGAGAAEPVPVEDGHRVVLAGSLARARCEVLLRVERDGPVPRPFEERAREMAAASPPALRPVPGIVPSPPSGMDRSTCVFLDLSAAATTDPRSAPFLVRGAPAFPGLPTGNQEVARVPFRLLDPERNGGKGLVVLEGAEACAGLPRSVEVPVGASGRWLAVLGNVTGWGPQDPGVGDRGAVAVYEVLYEDGSIGEVPLVTGRTADDWLGEPSAADVLPALRGPGWHLNVLVAELRPAPVRALRIRDLGTAASPVVAAVTIIR